MEMNQVKEKVASQSHLKKDITEGASTRVIENQTARIPSVGYLALAVGSMFLSTAIGIGAKQDKKWIANFVGQWAPCFMLLGIYNKIVKFESEFKRSQMN